MQRLITLATGLQLNNNEALQLCEACCQAKSTRKSFKNFGLKATRVFQIIYADLIGPFPETTPAGYRYVLGITDKYSNFSWIYLLKLKSDTPATVEKFFRETLTQGFLIKNAEISCMSTDRGSEFMNNELDTFLKQHGVRHQSGPPYTPEFNSIQERMNRTLVEMALAMLYQSGLPLYILLGSGD